MWKESLEVFPRGDFGVFNAEHERKKQQYHSMPNIPEHDAEEKREGNASEEPWICLLVSRSAVSLDNLLRCRSEAVSLE